jgi:predicted nucleotidyltransferase
VWGVGVGGSGSGHRGRQAGRGHPGQAAVRESRRSLAGGHPRPARELLGVEPDGCSAGTAAGLEDLDHPVKQADDRAIPDSAKLLSYDDALAVIERLLEVARSRQETLRSPIVLVGGTALAGWKIRAYSRDVDLYMPEISADAVEIVEQELKARYGHGFRLDVTTGENIWGTILVRDIATSPVLGTIAGLELRVLRLEDLFLLKLASGRAQDLDDLALIAPRTTADVLVDRWNRLIKWHGDRHAILGFADAFVAQLRQRYGSDPIATIGRLDLTLGQRELLLDSYHGKDSE